MKKVFSRLIVALAALLTAWCISLPGQTPLGGWNAVPKLSSNTWKFFGEHQHFSAMMLMTAKGASPAESITIPGKLIYSEGRVRYEIDVALMKGGPTSGQATGDRLKALGMDKLIVISRPDQRLSLVIYPGLKSYVIQEFKQAEAVGAQNTVVETAKIGKESLDGQLCIKSKHVITDESGRSEAIVWNAPALRNFPLKIEIMESGMVLTLLYSDVKFVKPSGTLFDVPAAYSKYDSIQTMAQALMKNRVGTRTPQGLER